MADQSCSPEVHSGQQGIEPSFCIGEETTKDCKGKKSEENPVTNQKLYMRLLHTSLP